MNLKHRDCLESLLYLDTWRGQDATGVAVIRGNGETEVLKAAIPGYEFLEGPRLRNLVKMTDMCWIGHNRFGTVGKNTRNNAHPFMITNDRDECILVGAHNGTLKNKWKLKDHVQFGTDSEALYNQIALTSVQETIPLIEGAWALTYYDHEADELRFIRNSERPLFYGWVDDKKTLVWASESWMVRVATSRAGLTLFEDKIYSFAEDTLYKVACPLKINDVLSFEKEGGLAGKQPAPFLGGTYQQEWRERMQNGGRVNYHNAQPETTQETQKKTGATVVTKVIQGSSVPKTTPSTATSRTVGDLSKMEKKSSSGNASKRKSVESTNVVDIETAKYYKGYAGILISKADLEQQLAGGCSWCEVTHISIDDKFGWLGSGKPVCEKCLEGGHSGESPSIKRSVH